MTIFDITLPITTQMPVWPGDPPVIIEQVESMDKGSRYNQTRLAMSVHTGTHVDAPHHILNNHQTVDALPLDVLTGPALVVQLPDAIHEITGHVLEETQMPSRVERLLLRTRNSQYWQAGSHEFHTNFAAVQADGARWLVQHGIRLVGVDYLSVAPYDEGEPTHRILLGAGIVVLEGLDLHHISPGWYDLFCLPLKISHSDGAPARAVLIQK